MPATAFPERLGLLVERVGGRAELARRSGVSVRSISHYLRGETQPNGEKATRLAAAGPVRVEWLLTGVEPMTNEPPKPAPGVAQERAAYTIGVADAGRFIVAVAEELRFDPGGAWTALLIELMTTDSLKPSGARKVLEHLAVFHQAKGTRDAAA